MPLPASMQKMGLVPANIPVKNKFRRLMIGIDGLTNTGKTEFIMSAPGPKVLVPVDASYDSSLDNPNPPASRRLDDLAIDNIPIVPNFAQVLSGATEYSEHYTKVRNRIYDLCKVPEIRTIGIDGDSDLYELLLLAEFGRLSQIHPLSYPMVDGLFRWRTKKLWDSGKIIIATHKLKDKYEDTYDANGNPIKDDKGKNVQRRVEGEYKRQGFRDQTYLWQIQIRHLYKAGEIKVVPAGPLKGKVLSKSEPQWGIRIMKCKPNTRLENDELWGDKANFLGLVQHIYPNIDPAEWGF